MTREAPALALTLRAREDLGEDGPWAVWAMPDEDKLKYLLANRPAEIRALAGGAAVSWKREVEASPGYAVWGGEGDRLTPASVIRFQRVKREVGLYYRDLFAHTLGGTDSERFLLMWVDGKVFGTIGMHLSNATRGIPYRDQAIEDERLWAWESYGFSARSSHYPKYLNRLLMMCLTCAEFGRWLATISRFPLGAPAGIRTACITKKHESKGNRGILKLILREARPDGRFHLVYQTIWRPGTYKDQLAAWCQKYGTQDAGGEHGDDA